jgi:lipopolysaccharide transport system ATP-binding protein
MPKSDNLAISVRNLGKSYTIYHNATKHNTIAEALVHRLRHPTETLEKETFWALQDVSFDIPAGQVVGIIGRNGAGKSTLLKLLSRITEPTTGEIDLYGRVGSLLEVGTGFHPELTGRENIFLNGAILGMTRREIDHSFDDIVAFSGTERFLDTPVKRYSSGMYVRLAFAVAAHLNPEILIVDEVLAVGDMDFQKKCIGKMDEVARSGRTVLVVSHSMSVINSRCQSGILLDKGRIKIQGDIQDVVNVYLEQLYERDSQPLSALRFTGVPDLGKQIRFTALELVSEDQKTLRFGEDIVIDITVESDINQNDLTFSPDIWDQFGVCVGRCFSAERFSLRAGEQRTFRFSICEPNLAPGSYSIGIGVGTGGFETARRDFDLIVGRPSFDVLSFGQGDFSISSWESNWGRMVFRKTALEPLSSE